MRNSNAGTPAFFSSAQKNFPACSRVREKVRAIRAKAPSNQRALSLEGDRAQPSEFT
jgi:hypothetical protein